MELALPGRDYYLKKSSENEIRAYHNYMVEVAQLLGATREVAFEEMHKVLQLERRLANVSAPFYRILNLKNRPCKFIQKTNCFSKFAGVTSGSGQTRHEQHLSQTHAAAVANRSATDQLARVSKRLPAHQSCG
jgi:predicted metalloendopeptidase